MPRTKIEPPDETSMNVFGDALDDLDAARMYIGNRIEAERFGTKLPFSRVLSRVSHILSVAQGLTELARHIALREGAYVEAGELADRLRVARDKEAHATRDVIASEGRKNG